MKRFLKNIGLFSLLVISGLFIGGLSLPYFYGNDDVANKIKYLSATNQTVSVAVFGSSRVHEQFLSEVFDTAVRGFNTKTFNFGSQGAGNAETYYLYENFIQSLDSGTLSFAILEIQPFTTVTDRNLFKTRSSYYLDLSTFSYMFNFILDVDRTAIVKGKMLNKLFLSKAFDLVNISKLAYLRKANSYEPVTLSGCIPHFEKDGKGETDGLRELLTERKEKATIFNLPSESLSPINIVHKARLLQLQAISKKKGVKLYFLISPKNIDYEEIAGFAFAFKESLIEVANSEKYPLLYDYDYAYDRGHLNYKGSVLFSRYIAKEFEKLIQ